METIFMEDNFMRRLFEKKNWTLVYTSPTTVNGKIECTGNFFEMVIAVFKIMIRKNRF